MKQLFCLGLGYSAQAYVADYGSQFDVIVGSVRSNAKRDALATQGIAGHRLQALVFDGKPSGEVVSAATATSHLLVSAPPASIAATLAAHQIPAGAMTVVYLSSLSVYGDRGGAEVDENAELRPYSERGRERIAAEEAWRQFGQATGCPVAILRLAGIYGPGRNALVSVAQGTARQIVKPGQVFNRIHVADIAQTIDATFERRANGTFNVTDDEPAPPQDVIAYAARLLGQPLPPEISFDDAKTTMSPMAQSFYAESKRALNSRMKEELSLTLRFPNYRAGLDALLAAGDHTAI
jgi:nucleoside-diphosphate-sugar epimerase